MDARLVIESDEAVRMATELAELTGQDVRDVVTDALRARLDREHEIKQRTAKILAVAADIRSHMREPLPTSDHSWLYGDDGLPV